MIDVCVGYVAVIDKKYAVPLGIACSNYDSLESMEKDLEDVELDETFDYSDLRYDVEDMEGMIEDDTMNEFLELSSYKKKEKRKRNTKKKYPKKIHKKTRRRH